MGTLPGRSAARSAEKGLLSPEMQAQAEAALQRYREHDQQAAPLPVVVS